MFPNIKWLRITPDRPGRGGNKTGIHSFQQQPVNDIRFSINNHIYRGSWRRDYDTLPYPVPQTWDLNHTSAPTIHGYVYPSLTDPSAAPNLTMIGQLLGPVDSHFWDFTTGTVRSLRPVQGALPQPATFINVNQRCFGGDGLAEAVIMDDRTPAIHAQKNQSLGIGTPTQSLQQTTVVATPNVSPDGTAYVYNSHGTNTGPYVNHPNPDNQLGTCITGDTVDVTFINSGYPGEGGGLALSGVLGADAVTSNTTPFTNTGTIAINSGSQSVLLSGATWPADYQYCGLAINFNGYSFVIAAHGASEQPFDINGNLTILNPANTQLLIQGIYDGPNYSGPYTITGCQLRLPIGTGAVAASTINGGVQGYSQSTGSYLVQARVRCTRANGYYRNLGNISLGTPSTDADTGGTAILTITDADMLDGKRVVTSVSNPFTAGDVGAPFFIDGCGSGGGVLSSAVGTFYDVGRIRLNDPNISGGDVTGANAWWGSNAIVADGAITVGLFALTSASNPFVPGDVGQTIVVEGAGAAGVSLITTIAAYVNAGQVTLAAAAGTTVTGAKLWWRGISVDTHAGPTYAYAWYDPETGHTSNISPMMQLPRPTDIGTYPDFSNITPVFRIDSGYLSYPTGASGTTVNAGTDGARFSHIIFFRTLSTPGSSTLYPIGSLQPFIGKVHPGSASTRGSWNPSPLHGWMGIPNNYVAAPSATGPMYWYDWSSDSDLLLSGGFRAPQYTNEKPMVLLRGGATQPGKPYLLAYWDRRLWVVNTQEPNKVAFSCDEAQCPLGVPEESFPPTNFLRLPSSADAKCLGMRTFGDKLVITTQQYTYMVAGNNESNYRLMKISSSMPGVGQYQMDEFPTYAGAEGEPTTVFFLGRDRIVYQWTIGGSVVPISAGIQDLLDATLAPPAGNKLNLYQQSRVHCVSAWGRRFVMVYPYQTAQAQMYLYDLDSQVWTRSFFSDGAGGTTNFAGAAAFTTIHGMDVPTNEVYAIYSPTILNVVLRSWVRDDTSQAIQGFFIETFPLNFDGAKTRKQLVALNIHTTGGMALSAFVQVNESLDRTTTPTFGAWPDPLYSVYGTNPLPVDGAGCLDSVLLAGQFTTTGEPLVGYRFMVGIQSVGADMALGKIFAIDIGYIDMEDPGEGDP